MKRPGSAVNDMPPRVIGGFEAAYIAPKKPSIWRAILRRLLGFIVVVTATGLLLTAAADGYVRWLSKGKLYNSIEAVPAGRPGLVLGTSPRLVAGVDNPYFSGRMQAAADLFKAGKVPYLIVSGDNRELDYNEPRAMRRALESLGVPADKIVSDYAGLRTLDSVVRVKEVFGQHEVLLVSQSFHNERAICLARHYEIDAIGFNAAGTQSGLAGARNWVRERMARVRMMLDLYVFDTEPKHLGPKEPVPSPTHP